MKPWKSGSAAGDAKRLEADQPLLPSSLLVVWKRKGEIQPRYAKLSSDNIEAATGLIESYKKHVGERKKALRDFTLDLENRGFEYRFVRGLGLLLERKGRFTCKTNIDPVDLRRRIFQATENRGLPTTLERRRNLIESVGIEMSLTAKQIEETFYADLDDELILESFDPPVPADLLRQYNLSLTQTLLFDCTELTFTAAGNWQNLFYQVKKHGLIYEADRESGFRMKIDGPASLFKLTRKYGVGIAKLLPAIVATAQWSVSAKILWKYTNEICNLRLDSQKHGLLLPKPRLQTVTYDSLAEEKFASKFQGLRTEWILKREPEPVRAGNNVIIPDFSLERSGLKVYLEIVGFWTEEYLLRKAEKLKQVEGAWLLLVDEDLACEKLSSLKNRPQLHFIYYHNEIPLTSVLRYLEKAFEKVKTEETRFLRDLNIRFTEPTVSYAELAGRIGVSAETVRSLLMSNPPGGYFAMPNSLISKEKLEQVRVALERDMQKSAKLPLGKATKIVEAEGVGVDADCTFSLLGYKIKWIGIDVEKAEVYKP